MKSFKILGILLFVCFVLSSNAFAIILPDPETDVYGTPLALQYGDFYSYSLPILAYFYDQTYGGGEGPGNPYYITSTPGAIKNDIVIGTGASGDGVETNFPNMDDAYATPSGVSGSPLFSTRNTTAYPDPTPPYPPHGNKPAYGDFDGDEDGYWDAQLGALNTYLNGTDLVFFFNNNQNNGAGEQNLYAWGQVWVEDLDNSTRNRYFDFTNTRNLTNDVEDYDSPGAATNTTIPYEGVSGTWPGWSDFVLSGGPIYIDLDTGVPIVELYNSTTNTTYYANAINGTPMSSLPLNVTHVFNHNLGANQAAYAIFSPELNELVKNFGTNGYDVLHGDFRMFALNNGYEQLFIQRTLVQGNEIPPIPEPATLFLLGSGVAGLALLRKKRSS